MAAEKRSGIVSRRANEYVSTGAFVPAAPSRQEIFPDDHLSILSRQRCVAGLVLGCAWTVYSNISAAGVYPLQNSAAYEAPVAKRRLRLRPGSRRFPFKRGVCLLPPPRMLSKPEEF